MRDTGHSPPATDLMSITVRNIAEDLAAQIQLNDALAAKVAEWKARAEKAEAALRAMEEDDRHLCKP